MIHDSKTALSGQPGPTDQGRKYSKMLNEIKDVIGCGKSEAPQASAAEVLLVLAHLLLEARRLPSWHPQQELSKVNGGVCGGVPAVIQPPCVRTKVCRQM